MPRILPVRSKRDRNAFIRFPWKIYADYPQWVPPIMAHQRRDLDPRKGYFFHDGFGSTAEFYLARAGGKVVGRIAAIRNERHLQRHDDGVGFFGFFECVNDPSVAGALLEQAEAWLSAQGLSISRGPTSFSIGDPAGVTVKGGDMRPAVQMAFTPPYYETLLETCGYRKVRDLHAYHLTIQDLGNNLFKYEDAFTQVDANAVAIRSVRMNELETEAKIFAEIFTKAWDRNWGATAMIPEDFIRLAKEMGPFFDERLGYVATLHGEPAGVFLAVADPWEIFHQLNGRIGLKGLWKVMAGRKRIRHCRLFLLGVLPENRDIPVAPLLVQHLRKHFEDFPAIETIEFSWVLEDNLPTRSLAEALGGKSLQVFRLYDKFI